MADPELYLKVYPHLMPAPVYWDGQTLQFRGLKEDLPALANWYYFVHMQNQLLFTTNMPCAALGDKHDCPGDPWATSGWSPRTTCAFSQFLAHYGISEKRPSRIV
jgi:hypothetical protein